LLIALLALPPLAITGKLAWREAVAQNLGSGALSTGAGGSAATAPANIRETRHNLSSTNRSRALTGNNTLHTELTVTAAGANTTSEVCVFCHTPHGANTSPGTPLWNRNLSGATYTPYSSSSIQATDIDVTAAALAAPSKLCLSCHDGTLALGQVANAPGSGGTSPATAIVTLANTAAGAGASSTGAMPFGRGQANANHGFTRRLGDDLRNDHPISFTYNAALATADGELRTPPSTLSGRPLIANRVVGSPKPYFPLVGNKVQCTTCHDPHKQTQKFLNTNRLVRIAPNTAQTSYSTWTFNIDDDQICVACHTRLGKVWAVSAHSHSTVANETYNQADAAMRDFPTGTTVWQAGCLNCHDPHTVAGSRRLLREGSSSAKGTTVAGTIGFAAAFRTAAAFVGGNYDTTSAIENTCYQCHSSASVITPTTLTATEGVPDIETEFGRLYHMPIINNDQGQSGAGNTTEVHDITDREGTEAPANLGAGLNGANFNKRHAECSDCHNPHRVVKADTFLGADLVASVVVGHEGPAGDVTRRTHVPARGTYGNQGNIAGGALRGIWGVEPSYTATGQTTVTTTSIWQSETVTFTVKKGDPGLVTALPQGTAGTNAASYLTREYQLCFKCHSQYANGPTAATDFPALKAATGRGGTATGTNGMTRYTDVAKEFAVLATDPPTTGTHQGEATNVSTVCSGAVDCVPAGASWDTLTTNAGTINHRSWHPVVFPTGRNGLERGNASFANIRPPFNTAAKIGKQTMQCSDCHGMSTSWSDGTGPDLTKVQGPHGSDQPFILKGGWGGTTNATTNLGNVTDGTQICGNCHFPVAPGTASLQSGYNGNHLADGNMTGHSCTRCHIAVPHGWKNKAFLVNKRCVGKEGGEATDCVNRNNYTTNFNAPPYYLNSRLGFLAWRRSRDAAYGVEANTCNDPAGDMKNCIKQAQ
jgi:hypothetical protein